MTLWVIDEWIDEMTVGSKREVTHDDFHRLLSHINYGGHICSPTCAESALINEDQDR